MGEKEEDNSLSKFKNLSPTGVKLPPSGHAGESLLPRLWGTQCLPAAATRWAYIQVSLLVWIKV